MWHCLNKDFLKYIKRRESAKVLKVFAVRRGVFGSMDSTEQYLVKFFGLLRRVVGGPQEGSSKETLPASQTWADKIRGLPQKLDEIYIESRFPALFLGGPWDKIKELVGKRAQEIANLADGGKEEEAVKELENLKGEVEGILKAGGKVQEVVWRMVQRFVSHINDLINEKSSPPQGGGEPSAAGTSRL
jgi:molybdopterin converting factor small subunit